MKFVTVCINVAYLVVRFKILAMERTFDLNFYGFYNTRQCERSSNDKGKHLSIVCYNNIVICYILVYIRAWIKICLCLWCIQVFFNDYRVPISKCLWFNVRFFSLYEVSHFLCFECIMNNQFKHFVSHPLPLSTSLGFKIESHVVFSFITFCLSPLKSFTFQL